MDEIRRFESFVNERFIGKIDKKEFRDQINKPFREGGVGLFKKKADRVTEYLEGVIGQRKNVENIFNTIEKNPELPILDEVRNIRNWLMEGYTGNLSQLQITALDQVISDRVKNFISADKVVGILDLSNSKFGVGLSFRAAQIMAEKLELLLNNDETKITPDVPKEEEAQATEVKHIETSNGAGNDFEKKL